MASLCLNKYAFSTRPSVAASSRRRTVSVKAFATDNGKQSLEEMNRLIGLRIKEAASHVNTLRVWQANAVVGKYVKQAAQDAAAGKLKAKAPKRS